MGLAVPKAAIPHAGFARCAGRNAFALFDGVGETLRLQRSLGAGILRREIKSALTPMSPPLGNSEIWGPYQPQKISVAAMWEWARDLDCQVLLWFANIQESDSGRCAALFLTEIQ